MRINSQFLSCKTLTIISELFLSSYLTTYAILTMNELYKLSCLVISLMCLNILEQLMSMKCLMILYRNYGMEFENNGSFDDWKYDFFIFRLRKIFNTFKMILYFCTSLYIFFEFRNIKPGEYLAFLVILIFQAALYLFIGFAMSINSFHIIYLYYTKKDLIVILPIKLQRNVEAPDEECAICMDKETKEWAELPCRHRFHYDCVNVWVNLRNNCPVCRQ